MSLSQKINRILYFVLLFMFISNVFLLFHVSTAFAARAGSDGEFCSGGACGSGGCCCYGTCVCW